MLREWNEKINLVSRKSILESFAPHYADSVFIANFAFEGLGGLDVFDLGSGAGFPGLIFAIRYPEVGITLMEKSQKKQAFLAAAISELGLKNARLTGGFIEGRRKGMFLGRAVFPRAELFQFYQLHLLPGSRFVTNLGGQSEISPAPSIFQKLKEATYTLPLEAGQRKIELFHVEQKRR